jgi:hypothetical protein
MNLARYGLLTTMILAAAAARLLPHPPNFTPIAAMALFGGACFASRRLALLVPLAALFVSDLVIGFHGQMLTVYGSTALIVMLGTGVRRLPSVVTIGGSSILGSILFYAITNFGVWVGGSMYPHTATGLLTCYAAGLPFLRHAVLGDLFYVSTMFGLFAAAVKHHPVLREPAVAEPA